jgi:hypothetical protein
MQRIALTTRPQRSVRRIGPHRPSRWRPRRGELQGSESLATPRHQCHPRLPNGAFKNAIDPWAAQTLKWHPAIRFPGPGRGSLPNS